MQGQVALGRPPPMRGAYWSFSMAIRAGKGGNCLCLWGVPPQKCNHHSQNSPSDSAYENCRFGAFRLGMRARCYAVHELFEKKLLFWTKICENCASEGPPAVYGGSPLFWHGHHTSTFVSATPNLALRLVQRVPQEGQKPPQVATVLPWPTRGAPNSPRAPPTVHT